MIDDPLTPHLALVLVWLENREGKYTALVTPAEVVGKERVGY